MRLHITRLSSNRAVLTALIAVIVLAVAATTAGYAAMSKTVTLRVDGKPTTVTTMASTVQDVLESEGIETGQRDVVAPLLELAGRVERDAAGLGRHDAVLAAEVLAQVAADGGQHFGVVIDGENDGFRHEIRTTLE